MSPPYPWLAPVWERLARRLAEETVPHALLLTGPAGTGKLALARRYAQLLLCTAPRDSGPCGHCRSCTLYQAGTHPDAREIMPAEEGRVIGIDAVRELGAALGLKPQLASYRTVIIAPAERLNAHAANSLLKTLEEPTPRAVLILVTHRPAALPATVRSRCQRVPVALPAREQALAWLAPQIGADAAESCLALSGGAPLAALEAATGGVALARRSTLLAELGRLARGQADPFSLAESWLKIGAQQTLYTLHVWVTDAIRLKHDGGRAAPADDEIAATLQALTRECRMQALFGLLDETREALRLTETQANTQLLLEDITMRWAAVLAEGQRRRA